MQLERATNGDPTPAKARDTAFEHDGDGVTTRIVRRTSRRMLVWSVLIGCLAFWTLLIAAFLR